MTAKLKYCAPGVRATMSELRPNLAHTLADVQSPCSHLIERNSRSMTMLLLEQYLPFLDAVV